MRKQRRINFKWGKRSELLGVVKAYKRRKKWVWLGGLAKKVTVVKLRLFWIERWGFR
jgi:transcription elongation factor